MQHGQRTQHSTSNKSLRQRTHAPFAREPDINDLTAATKIAARLAAEAAFALPQVYPLPQQPAQVSVRRNRSAGLAVAPVPEGNLESNTEQLSKSSRVFRVEAAPTPQSTAAAFAASATTTAAPSHNDVLATQTPDQPSSHRIASDKRPGPVMHVIHARPELQPERCLDAETPPPPPRLDVLLAKLQGVTPDLEMIALAQTFTLVDHRLTREWLRLSRQIDELHAKILAQVH